MIKRIGSGAYGEVWLARNTATGTRRAVKIVYRATFIDERPFNREFEGIKKFEAISHSHPSQLALFQVGKNDAEAYFYYAMELADSVPNSEEYRPLTLRAKLEQGRLPAERVLKLALALTEALAHLHSHGLIHRDVTPSNIIFVNGRPKLADIGLVTDVSDSRSIVGTEGYLSPEGPGTPAADIYALGKVLYEALTGLDRRQFPELPVELRQWHDHRQAIELNEIVLKACAKEPVRRYLIADAMLADLKLLERGKSVQKRRALQRGWSVLWKVAALMAIFSLGIPLFAWKSIFDLPNASAHAQVPRKPNSRSSSRRAFPPAFDSMPRRSSAMESELTATSTSCSSIQSTTAVPPRSQSLTTLVSTKYFKSGMVEQALWRFQTVPIAIPNPTSL